MILTWIIAVPAIGGVLAWVVSRWSANAARWVALAACAILLALAVTAAVTVGAKDSDHGLCVLL